MFLKFILTNGSQFWSAPASVHRVLFSACFPREHTPNRKKYRFLRTGWRIGQFWLAWASGDQMALLNKHSGAKKTSNLQNCCRKTLFTRDSLKMPSFSADLGFLKTQQEQAKLIEKQFCESLLSECNACTA